MGRWRIVHTISAAVAPLFAPSTDVTQFRGPAGVLAVVLLEIALGSVAAIWVTPVWGVVKRGFFLLVAWTAFSCALLALLSLRGPLAEAGAAGRPTLLGAVALTVTTAVFTLLLHLKRMALARAAGLLSVLAGVAAVVALALLRGDGGTAVRGVAAMLTGAAFLGATWDGMVLGHWYLVDRKLTARPMRAFAFAYTASVGLALVSAALAKGGRPTGAEAALNPLLLISDLTVWLAFGLVGVCALLAFFVHKLVAEGSIRAATGMLYLAVIMAFSAEFAAKVRFFTL